MERRREEKQEEKQKKSIESERGKKNLIKREKKIENEKRRMGKNHSVERKVKNETLVHIRKLYFIFGNRKFRSVA